MTTRRPGSAPAVVPVEQHALLMDGRAVRIRTVFPADRDALEALNEAASDRSIYLRFFSVNRRAAENYLDVLCRPASPDHHALLVELDSQVVAVAGFERVAADSAEFALLVADDFQHEGIGTLLLEQLAAVARRHRIARFTAEVLAENSNMNRTLRDLGYPISSRIESGVNVLSLDLMPTDEVLAALDARDWVADSASLRPLLAPSSVAVVGAGGKDRSVGRELLRNLVDGGYRGRLFVVNPRHAQVLGVPSVRSPLDLPVPVDLAIIAVPAGAVVSAVRDCGRRGVRAVLVISSGFGELGPSGRRQQDELVVTVRQYGMRLVGPNCLGEINTDPAVRLNATFAPLSVAPGGLALASQSGALGIAILRAAEECGLGISQFVSFGNKADVSGNDLLIAWAGDRRTRVIGLYLESFGNPRKFGRIARRVTATKPVLAIKAGRSQAGQRAGRSHTAAAAASDVITDALFAQAGVLRVDGMEQMLDAARVLCSQPLPGGPRIAVVGNSGGPGILAADAAVSAGLEVPALSPELTASIERIAPGGAALANPIDLGAAMQPATLEAAVALLLAAPEIDAVLGIVTQTLVADNAELAAAFGRAVLASTADGASKPVVLVQTGEPAGTLRVSDQHGIPVFGFPEPAAQALGAAWRYARLRQAPVYEPAPLPAVRAADARALVADQLADPRLLAGGGWLAPVEAIALLDCYGIAVCPHRLAGSLPRALEVAEQLGYPVAMKVAGSVVHKSDVGGVRLDLRDADQLRQAYAELSPLGDGSVLLQPMVAGDAEIIVGGLQDPVFGPVVMVGAGGVFADLVADRRFLLAPTDPHRAAAAIGELRLAKVLDGYRGRPPVSRPALAHLVSQLAALVDDLPEVAEIDLNPVLGRGEDLVAVDAKIRLAPPAGRLDPAVRQLAEPTGPPAAISLP